MTKDEYRRKCEAAREIGVPVFLNLDELDFLAGLLANYADSITQGVPPDKRAQERQILFAMTIGMKCARALEQ